MGLFRPVRRGCQAPYAAQKVYYHKEWYFDPTAPYDLVSDDTKHSDVTSGKRSKRRGGRRGCGWLWLRPIWACRRGPRRGSASSSTSFWRQIGDRGRCLAGLGGCVRWGAACGGLFCRVFCLAARPLLSCVVDMCQVRVILLFFLVLAYF